MKTNESSESIKDIRKLTDYQRKKFELCESLAKEFLSTKLRKKSYRVTGYHEISESDKSLYIPLTDEEVNALKAYMIEVNNRMYPEEQVSSWEEFDYGRLEVNGSEYWEEMNESPGIWKDLVADQMESEECEATFIEFNDWNYHYDFSCCIYEEDEKKLVDPIEFIYPLTDEEYIFLLALQLSENDGFTYNRLIGIAPKLAVQLNNHVDVMFFAIENPSNKTRPFTIIFDEIIADAKQLEEKMSSLWAKYILDNAEEIEDETTTYTFKVWIDGNYYLDDEEFEKEIPLSEKEVATIKKLIDDYEGYLGQGLMPILKTGPKKLYKKFYDVIYPKVFLYLFDEEYVEDMKKSDCGRSWKLEDFDYLKKNYGNCFYFDESYIVYFPEGWEPVKPSLSKDMIKEEILRYIKRWDNSRSHIMENMPGLHDEDEEAALYGLIDEELVEMVQEHIDQTDEATLSNEDFNLYCTIDNTYELADEIYEEYEKSHPAT